MEKMAEEGESDNARRAGPHTEQECSRSGQSTVLHARSRAFLESSSGREAT